ncbi:MAG TPA: hypothetical protein VGE93_02985 [Bryobacteraceae bacterium]
MRPELQLRPRFVIAPLSDRAESRVSETVNANVCAHLQGQTNVRALAIVFVIANNLFAREA